MILRATCLILLLLALSHPAYAQTPVAVIGDGNAGSANSKVIYSNGDVYTITVNPNNGQGQWSFLVNVGTVLSAGAVSSYQYSFWVWDGDDIRMYHPSGSLIATRAVPKCDGTLVVVGVAFFNGISLGVWGVNDAGKFGFSAPGLGGCFDGPVSPTPVSPSTWGLIKSTHKESDK